MKIAVQHLLLTLSLEEVNAAIAEFLKLNGYRSNGNLAIADIADFVATGELKVNAKKCEEGLLAQQKIIFPDILFERAIPRRNSLAMFLTNVCDDQKQGYANIALRKLEDMDQKILIFTYSLSDEISAPATKKTSEEIQGKFDIFNGFRRHNAALSQFAENLNKIFLQEVNKDVLTPKQSLDTATIMDTNIEECGFSRRTIWALQSFEIKKYGEIKELKEKDLWRTRNFGKNGFEELAAFKRLYKID